MLDIRNKLLESIEELGYPVYLQGSMLDDEEYPNSFFTFWNTDTPLGMFRDNKHNAVYYHFNVNFYSNDPLLVMSEPEKAIKLLEKKGFIIMNYPADVFSDEITHTGVGFDIVIADMRK